MKLTMRVATATIALLAGSAFSPAFAQNANQPDDDLPGRVIYEENCAACHDNPADTRAASFETLTGMTGEQIYAAISEGGMMEAMAGHLEMSEKIALMEYLVSGQTPTSGAGSWAEPLMCAADNRTVDLTGDASLKTFGVDTRSTRHASAEDTGLTTDDMRDLQVAWAIGFPDSQNVSAAPATVGNTTFINGDGVLAAFDTQDECVKWTYAGGMSRSPITYGKIDGVDAILYVTGTADVHAVNALTGEMIWEASAQPRRGDGGRVRSGVVLHDDTIIVNISASGVGGGGNYCCTGHGSVTALNAADGSWKWEWHTMEEATDNGLINSLGQMQRGPSGAPIWTQATIDESRNQVIVTSGENTSFPATRTSDAIIALDLDTGEPNWIFQAMENDIWNVHCRGDDSTAGPNCSWHWDDENIGRDFDFGGAAALTTVEIDGEPRDVFVAGQKSGHVWVLDAAAGYVIWERQIGNGTPLGGNHWGIAIDGERVFLTINDPVSYGTENPVPGVYTFDIATGEPVWEYLAEPDCENGRGDMVTLCDQKYGFSATPLVVDGALIAGTLDGKVFAFDGATGEILSVTDTAVEFDTINGVEGARGGSIDSHAVNVGNGMLLIGSGYASFRQTAGNVLVALEPAE